ncbi:hypothetical protein BJ875DRAFT_381988 [Amylocarpus encephaloides]|uniref:Zn(2)-C6 fungal-type domain-containing protein n=1 Tax=Amylocarpus encephaloides TaxID=45428 RepID=A0A9P7YEH1_9HELO|nr:hypothetical protein BJ875DRAFT_381988 [Amylocarpus encephaloides]
MEVDHPNNPPELPFNRACDACRVQKVRCLPNDSSATSSHSKSCQRCLKTDRQCIFTAPQKRKQRKRTDTRVAELEKEVEAMRALFDRKQNEELQSKAEPQLVTQARNLGVSIAMKPIAQNKAQGRPTSTLGTNSPWESPSVTTSSENLDVSRERNALSSSISNAGMDVIDRGIISLQTAKALYQIYVTDLFQHYPAVYLPPEITAESLRLSKPSLFLAIIAAASAKTDPHLYSTLHTEAVADYAHRTVVNSEKTLELVQAQIVTSIWYYPPGNFSQLKFYEYIHMATTMAMDIGVGMPPRASRRRYGGSEKPSPGTEQSQSQIDEEIEKRRTILVCYMICTGVSMSMRRPSMLRSNSWINDALGYLKANGNCLALDHILVAWVELLQITEQIVSAFSYDDINNLAILSEPRIQMMLGGFEQQLLSWKEKAGSQGNLNFALFVTYHHTQIFAHEIAMHDDHLPEDFLPPYRLDKVISIAPELNGSQSFIKATSMIISSSHALLDGLLEAEVDVLRCLPIFNFVCMTYTLVMLTKLYISSKIPASQVGSVINPSMIKLGSYLETLIEKLGMAVGPMECRAPFTFMGLLMRLQIWYKRQENDTHFKTPKDLYNVLDHCYLPPPPVLRTTPEVTDLQGLDQDTANGRMQESPVAGDDRSDNMKMMGLQELATMQPLPNFDVDWSHPDINQFLSFGTMDSNTFYGNWVPGIEIEADLNGQQPPADIDWAPQHFMDTSF